MQVSGKTMPPDELAVPGFALGSQHFQTEVLGLQEFLIANSQRSVCISAANLSRSDARLFQYLIAATQSWRDRGLTLEVADLPPSFDTHLAILGIEPGMIIRKPLE